MISKQTILNDLKDIGIKKGDILLVTADLGQVGFFYKSRKLTSKIFIELLLEAVGPEGTIVSTTFTKKFLRFKKNKNIIFHKNSPTTSGAFAKAILSDPRSLRSNHPTNSYCAIGKDASFITEDHDENSLSFSLISD